MFKSMGDDVQHSAKYIFGRRKNYKFGINDISGMNEIIVIFGELCL